MTESWLLEDLSRSVRGEWRILLVAVIVALGLAFAANLLWPERYEASAVLTVEVTTSQGGQSASSVNMDTERVVATSSEVLELATKAFPQWSVAELRDGIVVTVPKGAQVLTFTLTADTAATAADGANAVANAYHDHRLAGAKRLVDDASANLTARIAELSTEAGAMAPESVVRTVLEAQIQALQERQVLLESTSFNGGALVSPAVAPQESTKPSAVIIFGAALVLGIFVGIFLALIRVRLRSLRAMRAAAEVEPDGS